MYTREKTNGAANGAGEHDDVSGAEDDDFQEQTDLQDQDTSRKKSVAKDEGPACQSCRRKKAKCTRRQPCSQCVRYNVECVYDDKRTKPGMRTGAIETLSQRVATLENMFLGQGVLWQQVWRCLSCVSDRTTAAASDYGYASGAGDGWITSETLRDCTAQLKETLSSLATPQHRRGGGGWEHETAAAPAQPPAAKRRRLDNDGTGKTISNHHGGEVVAPPEDSETGLPPDDLVDALVEIYFSAIHPWIPMLHVRQFRARMADPAQRRRLTTIFHAIVSLCARFSDDPRLGGPEAIAKLARKSRQTVILQSMESFSVENLQAMIICAFDTIGSGRGPSAWSIVGSMTRTVEHLQLSVEDEDQPQAAAREGNVLFKRLAFLPPCSTWIEVEERRRVFWNVFLMDRFTSTASGWHLSLTSTDVQRRLPCEGALWEDGEPLTTPTPYFGVSDQHGGASSSSSSSAPLPPAARPETEDQASLGGFAYCIEATESLSLVTSFFLQRAVDVTRVHDVQLWLMRFKELDLRLVQWKLFLPERWREACALNADGNMDPNLTLAHITHNIAVVLLHQGIAYLSPEWQASPIRLPSASSAETCLAAATEVAIIADRFLQGTTIPTNPQFAFCLFICGRMFLAHAAYYAVPVPPEFDSLVDSLREISRRWNGSYAAASSTAGENLASKFATRLIQARQLGPGAVDIRQTAYSEEHQQQHQHQHQQHQQQQQQQQKLPRQQQDLMTPMETRVGGPSSYVGGVNTDSNGLSGSSRGYVRVGASPRAPPPPMMEPAAQGSSNLNGSPDSISLAFPPLPLAFNSTNSALATAMPSPHPDTLQPSSPPPGYGAPPEGHYMGGDAHAGGDACLEPGAAGGTGFEDLRSFLEYSFLPTQRVSMFSNHSSMGR